jgi:ketosteroid isomerase-like protein
MLFDSGLNQAIARAVRLIGFAALAMCLTAAHPDSRGMPQTPVQGEHAEHADSTTPVGTVTAFHAALASGDTQAALAHLTEDAMIFESGGVERSRAEYASHHLESDAAYSAAVPRTLVSRSHGEDGDAAWVMSVETVTGTYRSRAINSRSVETMLLRRVEGQWRIMHIHWSSAEINR